MAKISIICLLVYAACTFDQTVGLNFFYQANPVFEDLQSYPFISPYAAMWKPDCEKEENSGESSESSSSESSESSESSQSGESSESSESGESKKSSSSKESSSESESKESKESGESKKSGESSASEEKEGSSKEEGESKSSEGSSEGSEEKKKETPKKKKKKERKPLFPPRPYPFPPRQVQRIMYSPASSPSASYAYLPYRAASSYVVQQPISSYPAKSNIQYMSVPAPQSYIRYSPPVVGKSISGPVQKIVYSAASALNYPPISKTIISSGAGVYPMAGSWNSPLTYLKK